MEEFDLDGREFVELNSLLKLTGMSPSGGIAKMVIAAGEVTVDGRIEKRKRCKIKTGQVVEYDTQKVIIVNPPTGQ
jgi:ribosome-associated protein